ncbi:MAG: trypsin-like serine protease [Pseudomonadota bacterium]
MLTIDEQQAWSGVGRLNHSRGGYCSGALIKPDVVLTAAHCVVDEATGRLIPPRDLKFVAGLRAGVYTAHRRAVSVRVHPDWAGFQGDGKVIVPGDIAVVKLESPITSIEATSFSLGPPPDAGADVTLVSYGRGRSSALSIQEPCQVVERYRASAALNCDSVHGTSGAPVFRDGRIVGVISASDLGRGRGHSYAVLSDGAVQTLVSTAASTPSTAPSTAAATTTKHVSSSSSASNGGATRGVRSLFKKPGEFSKSGDGVARMPGGKKAPGR